MKYKKFVRYKSTLYSITQKPKRWQIKIQKETPQFKGFSLKASFQQNNGSVEDQNLKSWSKVLPLLPNKVSNPYLKQVGKQMVFGAHERINHTDAYLHLKSSKEHTVGIFLENFEYPLICLDIDISFIGYRFRELFEKNDDESLFKKVFKSPLIVSTESPGHLHLYYRRPRFPEGFVEAHKSFTATCRVGFPLEYKLKHVTFAGARRQILNVPTRWSNIEYLPKILYPYNGPIYKDVSFSSNLTGIRTVNQPRKESLIPKGQRHKTLLAWCSGDNFSVDEVKAIFYITCDSLDDPVKSENYANLMSKTSQKSQKNQISGRRKYWNLFANVTFEGNYVDPKNLPAGISDPFNPVANSSSKKTIQEKPVENKNLDSQTEAPDLNALFYNTAERDQKAQENLEQQDLENPELNMLQQTPQAPIKAQFQESFPVDPLETFEDSPSSLRLREGENGSKTTYKQLFVSKIIPSKHVGTLLSKLGFNPDRVEHSVVNYLTSLEVILFVAQFENRNNLFLKDQTWWGRSLETVIADVLLNHFNLKLINLVEDNLSKWYFYNGVSWITLTIKQIPEILLPFILQLNYAGLERSLNRPILIEALSLLTRKTKWPEPLMGITFKNGTLTISSENEAQLLPHSPDHYIRTSWLFDYDLDACLTPLNMRFIQDLCGGQTRLVNVLRFLLFLIFNPGHHQLGFYLYGDPGGSKSVLLDFLKNLDLKNQATIDPRSVSMNKFHVGTLVFEKNLVLIPDVSPGALAKSSSDFIKVQISGDSQVGEEKNGAIWNFVSEALLILASNYAPDQIKTLDESAIRQRLIHFPTPTLLDDFRVGKISQSLLENPAGLINWALNIPKEFVSRNLRAVSINEAVSPRTSFIDFFIEDQIIKEPDHFVPNADLIKAFEKYNQREIDKKKSNEPASPDDQLNYGESPGKDSYQNLSKNKGAARKFGSLFKTRLLKYADHQITESRQGKARTRGYINLNIVQEITDKTPENQMVKDPLLNHALEIPPFTYQGICLLDSKKQFFKQSNVYNKHLTENCEKVGYLVYNQNFKSLLQIGPPQKVPLAHLVQNKRQTGRLLEETYNWDSDRFTFWWKDISVFKEIPKKSLEDFDVPKISISENATSLINEQEFSEDLQEDFEENVEDSSQETEEELEDRSNLTVSPETQESEKEIEDDLMDEEIEDDLMDEDNDDLDDRFFTSQDFENKDRSVLNQASETGSEKKNDLNLSQNQVDEPPTSKKVSEKDIKNFSKSDGTKPDESLTAPQRKARGRPPGASQTTKTTPKRAKTNKKEFAEESSTDEDQRKSLFEALKTSESLEKIDEYVLFDHCFENKIRQNKNNLEKIFKESFSSAKPLFKEVVEPIGQLLKDQNFKRYETFKSFYSSSPLVYAAIQEFRFFPQIALFDFIGLLNTHFRSSFLESFAKVKFLKKSDNHSYFGRQFPGTNDLETPKEQFNKLNQEKFTEEKVKKFDAGWDGGSLFPLGYELGSQSYGRFLNVPRSSLSTTKHIIKEIVLKNISKKTGLNFVELDLKSCHSVIYQTLSQDAGYKLRNEIPDPTSLWSSLTIAFKRAKNSVIFTNKTFEDIINSWNDDQIKAIMKGSWYKGLNAGNVFKSGDILKNSRNKLNIPNKEHVLKDPKLPKTQDEDFDIPGLAKNLEMVNKKIVYLKDLYKFNDAINSFEIIYLPTQEEGFNTKTLSKKQIQYQKNSNLSSDTSLDSDSKITSSGFSGKTGMSRLFSTCEVVLVMIVSCILNDFPQLMPLAYEADGLLITGYIEDPERLLNQINKKFAEFSNRFMDGNFVLEFKQVFC